jgi:DNA-binding XRE family transcriptional regulator
MASRFLPHICHECAKNPSHECRLKKYRQLKNLTQEQLAIQVGVRRETIMRLEKAQYNPSLKLAIDISRAVDTPIEEIFIFK